MNSDMQPSFSIRRVSVAAGTLSQNLLETIGRLRIRAWEADGPRPTPAPASGDVWLDGHDYTGEHFVVERKGSVIASARVSLHHRADDMPDANLLAGFTDGLEWPAGSLNRLVVAPEARNCGLSRVLDLRRVEFVERAEASVGQIFVTTHLDSRIAWLQECGFRILGPAAHRTIPSKTTFVLARPVETKNGPDHLPQLFADSSEQ